MKDFNYPPIDSVSSYIPAISDQLEALRLPMLFSQLDVDTLPVIDIEGKLIGIVTEYDLAKVLPEALPDIHSYRCKLIVGDIMTREVWSEKQNSPIEKIIPSLDKMHARIIPIVDEQNNYTGRCFTRASLVEFLAGLVKPLSIGGLATPLGVYLTDGKHQAGVGNFALTLTGVSIALVIFAVQYITGFLNLFLNLSPGFLFIFDISLFLVLLRLFPLVKLHAAEHKTINAIEKGLPLSLKTVGIQSRVHRRCGTNLMALLVGVQILIILSYEIPLFQNILFHFAFLIAGFSFLFSKWQKIGAFIQTNFTTVEPSENYLKNGIKAGEELLELHKNDSDTRRAGFWMRVWNSGFLQIISGFILTIFLLEKIFS